MRLFFHYEKLDVVENTSANKMYGQTCVWLSVKVGKIGGKIKEMIEELFFLNYCMHPELIIVFFFLNYAFRVLVLHKQCKIYNSLISISSLNEGKKRHTWSANYTPITSVTWNFWQFNLNLLIWDIGATEEIITSSDTYNFSLQISRFYTDNSKSGGQLIHSRGW